MRSALRSLVGFACLTLSFSLALPSQAEDKQLRATLLEAQHRIDFEGEGAVPFRLTATFETFDYRGEARSSGTVEELFLKPGLHKRTINRKNVTEQYAAEDDVALIAVELPPGGYMERRLLRAVFHPGLAAEPLRTAKMNMKVYEDGGETLQCLRIGSSDTQEQAAYCFSTQQPVVLRLVQGSLGFTETRSDYRALGDRLIPGEVTIYCRGRLRGRLRVTSVKPAPELKETDVAPEERELDSMKDIKPPALVKRVDTVYPADAKAAHLAGEVALNVVVRTDGTVTPPEVVEASDDIFADSAVAAVSQYRLRPATRNGKPVPVEMNVVVEFKLY